ncbi:MAG: hypothetical protein Q7J27_12865 [Syntrophales bacterium]|nr:hypothetical protein [Syntrophales bacterium]
MTSDSLLKLSLKQTDPGLWVSRVVLFASINPLQTIREISLHRGLNIIWGVDEEKGDQDLTVVAGHGVGKTSFCRLLRYCLGEPTFGTKSSRERIRSEFAQGYVAAEVHVQGEQWAVARPIGNAKFSYAAQNMAIEKLIDNRPSFESYHKFRDMLEDAMLRDLVRKMVAGSRLAIKWEHLLAWCARDQEARFQSTWQWRSPRSESETPAFEKPKVDGHFVMRAVLGLLAGEEINLSKRLTEVQKEISETGGNIAECQKEPQYWCRRCNKKLKSLLGIDHVEDVHLEQNGLFSLPNRIRIEQERLKKEGDELKDKIITFDEQISDISAEIQAYEKELTVLISFLETTQAGLNELETDFTDTRLEHKELEKFDIEICRYGQVLLKDCHYIRDRLNLISFSEIVDVKHAKEDMTKREKAISQFKDDITQLENEVDKLRQQRQGLLEGRRGLHDRLGLILQQEQEILETLKELQSWTEILNGVRKHANLLDLQDKLNSLNQEKEQVETRLEEMLSSHSEHFEELCRVFDGAVKEALSKDYSGMVTRERGKIMFKITRENSLAGEAIDTLSILLVDMSAIILGICGKGFHPRFLIHDSPREADLGVRVYHSFLWFAANLHSRCGGSDQAPFQYIVTTTTAPPPELQTDEFVKVRLDAHNDAGLLFRKNIGTMSPERMDGNESLF